MPKARPPYLHRELSRHGKTVWFVRRGHGIRVRLRSEYDTQAFWREYREALVEGTPAPRAGRQLAKNSLAWVIDRYRHSSDWAGLSTATRKQRDNIFRAVIENAGGARLLDIDASAIREGRERRSATPHSANNFLKAMRSFFAWAVDHEYLDVDPTKGIKLLKGVNDKIGYHTWTEEEMRRYEDKWPVGTRERLAFDIMLYTGLRRGDVVKLGRQHIRDGIINFRTEKTGEMIVIPLLAPLAHSIAKARVGDLTFLVQKKDSRLSRKDLEIGLAASVGRQVAADLLTDLENLARPGPLKMAQPIVN